MPEALGDHDDDWLIGQMDDPTYWEPLMERRKPRGGVTLVNYNKRDALERLCLGEFNIAYMDLPPTCLRAAKLSASSTGQVVRSRSGRSALAGRGSDLRCSRSWTGTASAITRRRGSQPHGLCRAAQLSPQHLFGRGVRRLTRLPDGREPRFP